MTTTSAKERAEKVNYVQQIQASKQKLYEDWKKHNRCELCEYGAFVGDHPIALHAFREGEKDNKWVKRMIHSASVEKFKVELSRAYCVCANHKAMLEIGASAL